jgi:hypothetical protein
VTKTFCESSQNISSSSHEQTKATKEAKKTTPFERGTKSEENRTSLQDTGGLRLVLEVTISKNKSKEILWETAGVMFDEGSKYNMISKSLVARLKLEPQTKGKIRRPIVNKGLVVVDMLREDGTTELKLEPQTEGKIRKPIGNKGLVVVEMLREDGTRNRDSRRNKTRI